MRGVASLVPPVDGSLGSEPCQSGPEHGFAIQRYNPDGVADDAGRGLLLRGLSLSLSRLTLTLGLDLLHRSFIPVQCRPELGGLFLLGQSWHLGDSFGL
jgi:hypothetical protein